MPGTLILPPCVALCLLVRRCPKLPFMRCDSVPPHLRHKKQILWKHVLDDKIKRTISVLINSGLIV